MRYISGACTNALGMLSCDHSGGREAFMAQVEEVVVSLADDEIAALTFEVRGRGGWQDLFKELQMAIDSDKGTLTIGPGLSKKVIRCHASYGKGGFQDRLEPVASALGELANALGYSAKH